jgi:type II secretory pathway pseudopilin PulG
MKRLRDEAGFTLMEVVIAISLIVLAFTAIMPLYFSITKYVVSNRERAESNTVAARDMERIRSVAYEKVGLVSGNPSGIFVAEKDETRADGKIFHISTRISWVDDPMDGTAAAGTDPMPNDYKIAKVTVTNQGSTTVLAEITSNIARASEEPPVSGGNIIVKVFLADGVTPLSDVQVNITTGPSSPEQGWTLSDGTALFAELTPSVTAGDYTIAISKDGYIVRPDQYLLTTTVIFGQTRTVSFIMDQPGHLTVRLQNPDGSLISKVSHITVSNVVTGDKTYDANSGLFDFPAFFPGDYQITATATSYLPSGSATTVTLPRNGSQTVSITLQPIQNGHLNLTTYDNETHALLSSTTVKLTNQSNGQVYNTTTNASGNLLIDLEPAIYTMDLSHDTYQPYTAMVTITSSITTTTTAYLLGYPQVGSIRVKAVKNSNGKAKSGVLVRVTGSGYDQQGTTNSSGEVVFSNLNRGAYTVYRTAQPGWTDPRGATVTAGNETLVTFSF